MSVAVSIIFYPDNKLLFFVLVIGNPERIDFFCSLLLNLFKCKTHIIIIINLFHKKKHFNGKQSFPLKKYNNNTVLYQANSVASD